MRWFAKLVAVLLLLIPASAVADEVISQSSKPAGSAGYQIVLDDVRDQLVHYELFPGMAYFGRGITLGFAGGVDLRPLSFLKLEIQGQGPYKTFIQSPKGPFIGDVALVFGKAHRTTDPTSVELKRSSKFRRVDNTSGVVTTKTLNLNGVPLSESTRSPLRAGARLYHGSTDPAAPSGRNAVDKRVDGTILWAYVGFGTELMYNWKVLVEGHGTRSNRAQVAFAWDLMYAPLRDYAEEVSDARDDFLFPFGTRLVTRFSSVAPLGFASKLELGLSGAGAGYYAMIAVGVGGSAVPFGKE